jgi:CBS domain containing-hemolysin-like protein
MFELHTLIAATASASDGNGSVAGLLLFIGIALSISFLCSILEAVLLSTSLSHVELTAQTGSRAGRIMRRHKQNVDQPISAILTLNTIAHTVGAAGAGAQAAAVFGNEWIGVISAILTLLILVFSEIIPKTLGAIYWKQLMPASAFIIQGLIISLYPAVWAFQKLTQMMGSQNHAPRITRSELEVLAQVSRAEGALQEKESSILRNLLRLGRVQVEDIMTPRTVVLAFQKDMTVSEAIGKHAVLPYSRIPLYDKTADDISSFILRYDLLKEAAEDNDAKPLHEFSRPVHVVPGSLSVAEVLEVFMSRREHMLLVLDEYGGTAGIITLEDAIEALLGSEIIDESDIVADMRELARQRLERYQDLIASSPLTTPPVVPSNGNQPTSMIGNETETTALIEEPQDGGKG